MAEKSIAEKLQIKPNTRLYFVNAPTGYLEKIGTLPEGVQVLTSPFEGRVDFLQVFIENRQEMVATLPVLKSRLMPKGALWVSYHKGTSQVKTDINRDSIWKYAQTIGLDAVRMIAIDDDWSTMRLKITS